MLLTGRSCCVGPLVSLEPVVSLRSTSLGEGLCKLPSGGSLGEDLDLVRVGGDGHLCTRSA